MFLAQNTIVAVKVALLQVNVFHTEYQTFVHVKPKQLLKTRSATLERENSHQTIKINTMLFKF